MPVGVLSDLDAALIWTLSVAALLVGFLAWRGSAWKAGWALVVALFGFAQVWQFALQSMGFGAIAPRVPWFNMVARPLVGNLPVLVALALGAVLAWSWRPGQGVARDVR